VSPQEKSGIFVNAGPLFGRATAAYERAKRTATSDREPGQMDALEAIVFSVVALEAFINEAAELATLPGPSNPARVTSFARLIEEVERSHGSLHLRFMLAHYAFAGETYEPDRLPFQDFVLLVDLRNALIHYSSRDRSRESFTLNEEGVPAFTPAKIVERLRARNIAAEVDPPVPESWLQAVATVAVARWSCTCAATMVGSILDVLPESLFKMRMEFFYRMLFRVPGKDQRN